MSDLRELYQEVILDHHKHPRNRGHLEHPTCVAHGHNPLCGDQLAVFVEVADDRVRDIRFEGSGCAISTASASMMTDCVKGMTLQEADALFHRMHGFLTGEGEAGDDADLGKLAVFAGIHDYPARVKCATLAWHTLEAALKQEAEPVTTE